MSNSGNAVTERLARPACAREVSCKWCGYRVWLAPVSPQLQQALRRKSRWVMLEPARELGLGSLLVSGDQDHVVLGGRGPYGGDLAMHKCPEWLSTCKYCGKQVIILALPLGGEQRLAVVDPEVNENGTVVVVEGYAVSDPDFLVNGKRYLWHSVH